MLQYICYSTYVTVHLLQYICYTATFLTVYIVNCSWKEKLVFVMDILI